MMNNATSIMGVNVDYRQVVKRLVRLGEVVFAVNGKNKGWELPQSLTTTASSRTPHSAHEPS